MQYHGTYVTMEGKNILYRLLMRIRTFCIGLLSDSGCSVMHQWVHMQEVGKHGLTSKRRIDLIKHLLVAAWSAKLADLLCIGWVRERVGQVMFLHGCPPPNGWSNAVKLSARDFESTVVDDGDVPFDPTGCTVDEGACATGHGGGA